MSLPASQFSFRAILPTKDGSTHVNSEALPQAQEPVKPAMFLPEFAIIVLYLTRLFQKLHDLPVVTLPLYTCVCDPHKYACAWDILEHWKFASQNRGQEGCCALIEWLASYMPSALDAIAPRSFEMSGYNRGSDEIIPDEDASDFSPHTWKASPSFDGVLDGLNPSVELDEALDDYDIRHHLKDKTTCTPFLPCDQMYTV